MLKGLYGFHIGFLGRHGSYLLVYRSTRLLSDSVPIVNIVRFRRHCDPYAKLACNEIMNC